MAAVERWPPLEVTRLGQKLDALSELVRQCARTDDTEVANALARLLVVRSSGYVEQVIYETCRSFVEEKSGGLVRAFAHSWLERTRIPEPSNIVMLLGRFDKLLADEFEEIIDADDEELRRELMLLVDRRNRIAHGQNEGITPRKALDLYVAACGIADWFVLRMNPFR